MSASGTRFFFVLIATTTVQSTISLNSSHHNPLDPPLQEQMEHYETIRQHSSCGKIWHTSSIRHPRGSWLSWILSIMKKIATAAHLTEQSTEETDRVQAMMPLHSPRFLWDEHANPVHGTLS